MGGCHRNSVALVATFFMFASLSFAGDVAAFEDIGFSEDGKTYIFGEYGKTDKRYEAWAEIYAVDIASNDYENGGVFITKPSPSTASISGKQAYKSLFAKNKKKLDTYGYMPSSPENLLYIRGEGKKIETSGSLTEILFKDYEYSTDEKAVYYHIKLVPTVKGSGVSVSSSYYITMNREDEAGHVLKSWKIGNPDIIRKGVSAYSIEKIFTDDLSESLVFVIQKFVVDDTGTSIRYMVETAEM